MKILAKKKIINIRNEIRIGLIQMPAKIGGGGGGIFVEIPEMGDSGGGVSGSVNDVGELLRCCDNVSAILDCDCDTSA